MKSEWTLRRYAEKDWSAVERSWKNAVSEKRGIINSLLSCVVGDTLLVQCERGVFKERGLHALGTGYLGIACQTIALGRPSI